MNRKELEEKIDFYIGEAKTSIKQKENNNALAWGVLSLACAVRGIWDTNSIGPKLGDTRKMHCRKCHKETDHLHGKGKKTGRLYWKCLECRDVVYFTPKEQQ